VNDWVNVFELETPLIVALTASPVLPSFLAPAGLTEAVSDDVLPPTM
jgi:hypothetical protein